MTEPTKEKLHVIKGGGNPDTWVDDNGVGWHISELDDNECKGDDGVPRPMLPNEIRMPDGSAGEMAVIRQADGHAFVAVEGSAYDGPENALGTKYPVGHPFANESQRARAQAFLKEESHGGDSHGSVEAKLDSMRSADSPLEVRSADHHPDPGSGERELQTVPETTPGSLATPKDELPEDMLVLADGRRRMELVDGHLRVTGCHGIGFLVFSRADLVAEAEANPSPLGWPRALAYYDEQRLLEKARERLDDPSVQAQLAEVDAKPSYIPDSAPWTWVTDGLGRQVGAWAVADKHDGVAIAVHSDESSYPFMWSPYLESIRLAETRGAVTDQCRALYDRCVVDDKGRVWEMVWEYGLPFLRAESPLIRHQLSTFTTDSEQLHEDLAEDLTACGFTAPDQVAKVRAFIEAQKDSASGAATTASAVEPHDAAVPTEADEQSSSAGVTHDLKCWPAPFRAISSGAKTFEFRKNDRGYQRGDLLHLREWRPDTEQYVGSELVRRVSYVLTEGFGLPEGYCIMSLAEPEPDLAAAKDARPMDEPEPPFADVTETPGRNIVVGNGRRSGKTFEQLQATLRRLNVAESERDTARLEVRLQSGLIEELRDERDTALARAEKADSKARVLERLADQRLANWVKAGHERDDIQSLLDALLATLSKALPATPISPKNAREALELVVRERDEAKGRAEKAEFLLRESVDRERRTSDRASASSTRLVRLHRELGGPWDGDFAAEIRRIKHRADTAERQRNEAQSRVRELEAELKEADDRASKWETSSLSEHERRKQTESQLASVTAQRDRAWEELRELHALFGAFSRESSRIFADGVALPAVVPTKPRPDCVPKEVHPNDWTRLPSGLACWRASDGRECHIQSKDGSAWRVRNHWIREEMGVNFCEAISPADFHAARVFMGWEQANGAAKAVAYNG
jgi:hypothetical protein